MYAERGLIQKGFPNLNLLNILFWLFYIVLVIFSFGVYPLSSLFKGSFLQGTSKGQICMKIDFRNDQQNSKLRIIHLFFPLMVTIQTFRYKNKINSYVKGQNLRMKTFSQFGGRWRRNLITLDETNYYLFVCYCFLFSENILIFILQIYREKVDKNIQFILQNLLWVVFLDIFFGIYVPLKHIIQSRECLPSLWFDSKKIQDNKFYVREPCMSPRRDCKAKLGVYEHIKRIKMCKQISTIHAVLPLNNIDIKIHKTKQSMLRTDIQKNIKALDLIMLEESIERCSKNVQENKSYNDKYNNNSKRYCKTTLGDQMKIRKKSMRRSKLNRIDILRIY